MSDIPQSGIPLAVPNIGAGERQEVLDALDAGWVSTAGPQVSEFERQVAKVSGTDSAVAIASGTAAIMIALKALGVGAGDFVLCPTYTFIATANAITAAGGTPVFVDVSPDDWSIDPAAARAAVLKLEARWGRRPKAIVCVYPMGNPVDTAPLLALCAEFGMKLVADAAAAIGALWDGAPIGRLADATTFSFNGNKTITTGGGGAVVGSPDLLANVRSLATTGRVGVNYDHDRPAYNERITNLEAALGVAQMKRLDGFLAAKTAIDRRYRELASALGCSGFPRSPRASNGNWFSGLVLNPGDPPIREVVAQLNAAKIGTRLFWKPMHQQDAYAHLPQVTGIAGSYPVADALWERVLVLPCSTHLAGEHLDYVCATVETVVGALRRKPAA